MSITRPLDFVVALLALSQLVKAEDDPLAAWRQGVTIRDVAPDTERHSIHSYFNTSPESPEGKYVLYYTSEAKNGEYGDLRILERATGRETIVARDITTEDAHRAACQQWSNGGKSIVYHEVRDGHWRVMAVDVSTLKAKVLVEDRQVGFGSATGEWVPAYGQHWNPGQHRNLELVHVVTGEVRTPVTSDRDFNFKIV
ncbi:MAG: hypothetical protein KDA66_20505 [Planctomycetaceae bacterium]|nr:hypothetical protein [Planctomycetaceae bacterium]